MARLRDGRTRTFARPFRLDRTGSLRSVPPRLGFAASRSFDPVGVENLHTFAEEGTDARVRRSIIRYPIKDSGGGLLRKAHVDQIGESRVRLSDGAGSDGSVGKCGPPAMPEEKKDVERTVRDGMREGMGGMGSEGRRGHKTRASRMDGLAQRRGLLVSP